MRWYVIENKIKRGPFDAAELREKLRCNELTLDSIVMKEGSPARIKLSVASEITHPSFSVIPPTSSFANEDERTAVSPAANQPLATNVAKTGTNIGKAGTGPLISAKAEQVNFERESLPMKIAVAAPKVIPHNKIQPKNPLKSGVLNKPSSSNKNPIKVSENSGLYQLPVMASEGVLKFNKEIHWQKDRLNTTSRDNKSEFREQPIRMVTSKKNQLPLSRKLYTTLGIVFGILFILISFITINKCSRDSEKNLQVTERPVPISPPQNSVQDFSNFGEGTQIAAEPPARKSPKKPEKKPENFQHPYNQPKKSLAPEKIKEVKINIAQPKPDLLLSNLSDLASHAFKIANVGPVSFSVLPSAGCAPCLATGTLHDGTRINLISSTIIPWIPAKKAASMVLIIKGLIQQKGAGEYSIIVQGAKPHL